ncbi:phosphatidylglycerophosphatase A family protein [Pasteurella dagmatis]|uniref:Phosphatidylglycerophosphatase A n=1 Tax=Pasteurella dagmatis ATCC 43325 TaxID=667128 RepID=C9PQP6_9PAST|nr:phosphatidylglycerophosphatase A [Pasteurella dagmatis]EEX50168.1 phosphatidylglycerophosphatase A [Pasteurella dagmatis ATCC 43325]SNV58031.1 phosphatidylglycerophosphatase A [Pasteurella dagmatis]
MKDSPLQRVSLTNLVHFLALGFGSGLMRSAPGTWGSLVGLVLGWLLLQYLSPIIFFILTALCFALGCYLCQKTADDMGVHDHGAIVWDEIVGVFLVLLALPELSLFWCVGAFLAFRFFDILKPFPIRYFDHKIESGFGIMLDDVLAAIYAILVLVALQYFL